MLAIFRSYLNGTMRCPFGEWVPRDDNTLLPCALDAVEYGGLLTSRLHIAHAGKYRFVIKIYTDSVAVDAPGTIPIVTFGDTGCAVYGFSVATGYWLDGGTWWKYFTGIGSVTASADDAYFYITIPESFAVTPLPGSVVVLTVGSNL